MINKRGQMAVWVIVALVIVVTIVLVFILRGKVAPVVGVQGTEDPKGYIDNCVRKNVNDAVDLLLPQGGFINTQHTKTYKSINIEYLCYNQGNYYPCINEHPMFLNEVKEEIFDYTNGKIEGCFEDYKVEMEKRGADIVLEPMNMNIELAPERIYVAIDRKVTMTQKEESYSIDEFNIEIINPVYDLGRIAMEIASQEAKYCYFEYVGYMILYPKFKISVFPMSDNTKIYTIEDKKSGKKMNIAIRSCAIPPGF